MFASDAKKKAAEKAITSFHVKNQDADIMLHNAKSTPFDTVSREIKRHEKLVFACQRSWNRFAQFTVVL